MDAPQCLKSDDSNEEGHKAAQSTSLDPAASAAAAHEQENDNIPQPPHHSIHPSSLTDPVEALSVVPAQPVEANIAKQSAEIEYGPPVGSRDVERRSSPQDCSPPQDFFSDSAGASSSRVEETEPPSPCPNAESPGPQQDNGARDFQRESSSVITPSPTTSDEPLQFRDSSVSRSDTSSRSSRLFSSAQGHHRSSSPPLQSAQELSLSSPHFHAHEQGSPPLQHTHAAAPALSRQLRDQLAPLQISREVDDESINLSNWNTDDFDSDDLKQFFSDCDSDGDSYLGSGPPSLGSPSPPPRHPSTSRIQIRGDRRVQASSPNNQPSASSGPPEQQNTSSPDESSTRAGKRKAFSPPPLQVKVRRHRLIFDPPDNIKELIVTCFIDVDHWEQVDWTQIGLPSAVLARHGSDPRQRIRAWGLLWFARDVLALRGISHSWTRVIERSPEWLEMLSRISRLSTERLLSLAREKSGKREQLSPLGVFQSWLRERCLGCLLNNVNVDLRGLREGLSSFNHWALGEFNLCRVHIESCADCEDDEEPDMICHQCLMAPQRPSGERECRILAVCGPPAPGIWMPNECSDCRHDYFMGQFRLAATNLPRMYWELYSRSPTYDNWIFGRKGGKNFHQLVNRVIADVRRLLQKESCTCRICERQKRLREEEEESGAFGSVGRNGAGQDKRIKTH